ncbi:MAG TPA: VOC family protein [Polyangiaceae bacterium]
MLESARPVRLHHLAIGTRDVARLSEFYRDVFALEERARHLEPSGALRSVWLDAAGCLLMIERTDESPRQVSGVGAGLFLIAFTVSPEERTSLEAKLTREGCTIEHRSPYTSYTRDIDGNRIAISHYPSERIAQAERLETAGS